MFQTSRMRVVVLLALSHGCSGGVGNAAQNTDGGIGLMMMAGNGGQAGDMGGGGGGVVTNGPSTGHGLFTAGAPWYEDVSQASVDGESTKVITGLAAKGGWGGGQFRVGFF